jgi:ketosteroid isomerase-like protein
MRITRRYLAAAAGAFALAATSLPGHAESADDAAVRKAIDNLIKAMTAADKAALEAVVSDQLSFGHSSARVETKAEFVGNILDKKPIYKSITLGDPTISVVGNNAIARYTAAVEADAGGKEISVKLAVVTIWVKDGGTWKLLAHQSFKPT